MEVLQYRWTHKAHFPAKRPINIIAPWTVHGVHYSKRVRTCSRHPAECVLCSLHCTTVHGPSSTPPPLGIVDRVTSSPWLIAPSLQNWCTRVQCPLSLSRRGSPDLPELMPLPVSMYPFPKCTLGVHLLSRNGGTGIPLRRGVNQTCWGESISVRDPHC